MFAMYSLRLAEFDDACYVRSPIGGVGLVDFGVVRRWSSIGGVVDEVSLQAPVGGVILTES
ncbi:hypothetical protein H5410_040991 [Solanum commersonii]|uniref:Uncharacterized protein n=1 Tax=Solanum commersonii TaxID=4109 RepID=A0A9J5XRR3_SOLCO|nr:hypothetical protein H5410_040991 [Solanum commersonii]